MSEILMLDMEMWFIDSFDDIINMTEKFVNYTIEQIWQEWEKILTELWATKPLVKEKYPRISVKDLHQLMKKETWQDFTDLLDLTSAEEKFICEYSAKNWWSDFVIVDQFPWSDAKFYHHQNIKNPEVADRADLLFRWVEIITLTQREVNYEKLVAQIKAQWLDSDHAGLKYYLDAFKYWMPDEWWFGFGIARFVQKIIWLDNAKEAELFPRDVNRVTP
jgi:nondiscriminating aspartyl-tRNA synthetase